MRLDTYKEKKFHEQFEPPVCAGVWENDCRAGTFRCGVCPDKTENGYFLSPGL